MCSKDGGSAQAYEHRVLDSVRSQLTRDAIEGLHMQALELEGRPPGTWLVLTFKHASRPGRVFGYRRAVWSSDPEEHSDPYFPAMGFIINLREEIDAPDLGLPTECSPAAITWIGRRA